MQFKRIRWASRLVVGLCLIGAGGLAMAQGAVNWPQRPIRIVIPHPPGGPSDLIARTVLERLHTTLKRAREDAARRLAQAGREAREN